MSENETVIKELTALDPKKIYFLKMSSEVSGEEGTKIAKEIIRLNRDWGIRIWIIFGDKLKFINLPEGYELVKKTKKPKSKKRKKKAKHNF